MAAALGNPAEYVAVDDFSKDGGSADTLRANAERFGAERLTVLEGDAFELLRDGALAGRTSASTTTTARIPTRRTSTGSC